MSSNGITHLEINKALWFVNKVSKCVDVCYYLLSHVAFRGGVEGDQFHCTGVFWSHLKQHFLERVKLIVLVYIILVHLNRKTA